jgi:hypothetical protein
MHAACQASAQAQAGKSPENKRQLANDSVVVPVFGQCLGDVPAVGLFTLGKAGVDKPRLLIRRANFLDDLRR